MYRTNEVIVTEIDGSKKAFNSVKEAASYYRMSSTAIRNRLTGIVKEEQRKFEYGNIGCSVLKHRMSEDELKDRYENIQYETLGTRLCITPCRLNGDIKVGSALCQGCIRFRGMDRVNHIVLCEKRKNVCGKEL